MKNKEDTNGTTSISSDGHEAESTKALGIVEDAKKFFGFGSDDDSNLQQSQTTERSIGEESNKCAASGGVAERALLGDSEAMPQNSEYYFRIPHGQQTPLPSDWPFSAFVSFGCKVNGVETKLPGSCSVSIIAPSFVLTAGHCVYKLYSVLKSCDIYKYHREMLGETYLDSEYVRVPIESSHIYVGIDSTDETKKRTIKRIVPHPAYNRNNFIKQKAKDLALIELMEALTFNDDMRAVCLLSDYTPSMTDWGFAIGFGKTAGALTAPESLDDHKKHKWEDTTRLREDVLSLKPVCLPEGDSGGALLVLIHGVFYQIGVHQSLNEDTDTSYHAMPDCTWIRDVTNGQASCVEYWRIAGQSFWSQSMDQAQNAAAG